MNENELKKTINEAEASLMRLRKLIPRHKWLGVATALTVHAMNEGKQNREWLEDILSKLEIEDDVDLKH